MTIEPDSTASRIVRSEKIIWERVGVIGARLRAVGQGLVYAGCLWERVGGIEPSLRAVGQGLVYAGCLWERVGGIEPSLRAVGQGLVYAGCPWERVKGIEPSLRAWEARVLPLNYTRMCRPEGTKAFGSREDGYCSPNRHQHPYRDEKSHPPGPVGGLLYPFGRLASSVLPPSETVAEEKGEAEPYD